MKGKYKRKKGWKPALSDQKIVFVTAGIFLLSISAHLAGFLTVKGMADDGIAVFWKWVLPLCFGFAGILCIGSSVLQPQLIRPLLYLGGAYLAIQLVLSLIMGGIALTLNHAFVFSGEDVKTTIDIIIRVIQIPLRAGACLFLMERLTGRPIRSAKLFAKFLAALTVYTTLQYLAGMIAYSPFFLMVRVLTAGILAVLLWSYIYQVCRKAGEHHEA